MTMKMTKRSQRRKNKLIERDNTVHHISQSIFFLTTLLF